MLKILRATTVSMAFFAVGCAPAFRVSPVSAPIFPPTREVAVVDTEPQRSFTVIARFSGYERSVCAAAHPYCSLYARAKAMGADAIWITQRSVDVRPDLWVDIRGRPTRIPSSRYERVEGVFLRYRDHD